MGRAQCWNRFSNGFDVVNEVFVSASFSFYIMLLQHFILLAIAFQLTNINVNDNWDEDDFILFLIPNSMFSLGQFYIGY